MGFLCVQQGLSLLHHFDRMNWTFDCTDSAALAIVVVEGDRFGTTSDRWFGAPNPTEQTVGALGFVENWFLGAPVTCQKLSRRTRRRYDCSACELAPAWFFRGAQI
jgi:hypothetical protein